MFTVYEIRNIENNYIYIGSTRNFNKRIEKHFKELRNNKHHSYKLQDDFNLYGESKFKSNILFNFDTEQEMVNKEKELINDLTNKYNVSKCVRGGDIISYHPKLKEIKKKHSNNYSKIKQLNNGIHPLELVNKEGINNHNWKHGKYCNNKTCIDCNKKITTSAKQRCGSCASKLRIGSKNAFYGKKHKPESIAKMKQNRHLQKLPSNTLKIKIDNTIYDSASKASKVIGCTVSSILNRCRNDKFTNYEFYKGV